ncbi:MAG: glycoside hydrolase family 97 N-terminal domain-containing protein, partial [Bacteroidaceae bacterium]|nr:glycoside hydrolase family 97 N-terminal domain-containing protein [Bacteroidaceae bacterium]
MMNKSKFVLWLCSCLFLLSCGELPYSSPDGELRLVCEAGDGQSPSFKVYKVINGDTLEVMHLPMTGVWMENGIGRNLHLNGVACGFNRSETYTMQTGKRNNIHCEFNEYTYTFKDSLNHELRMVFRLYNDGVAFRYEIPQLDNALIQDELTTYRIPEGQKRWVQSYDPSYERFYPESVTGESENKHWAYPALFQVSDEVWMLISEAGIEKYHSASSLKNEGNVTDYKVALGENKKPFSGDWYSPWRVAIIGSSADVVESTLITDVSPESRLNDNCPEWIQPGAVSWIYWAYNHGSNDYQIVKKYIDMAVELSLPYVLIDAEWDEMGNGGTIEDALAYARECGVKPLIWYNSSTGWIKEWGAPGPHERLNDPVKREKEFAWLNEMGVVGVKIDFFAGDTQETMEYCIDLLESAAKYKLMVNFHGAT